MQQEASSSSFSDLSLPGRLLVEAEWAGIGLLVLLAGLALVALAWVIARVLSSVARHTLNLLGRPEWADGFSRRHVFRNIGLALPLLAVLSNLPLLALRPDLADLLVRVFTSAGVVFIFLALIGVLRTWEDIYSN